MAIERIKILLADDHQMFLDAINLLFKDAPDMDIVDEANNGDEVIDVLSRRKIDIILMDVQMPGKNGLETTIEVKQKYPEVKVLALTGEKAGSIITKMIDAGASGYVSKNCTKEELLSAVRKVYNGSKFFSSDVSEIIMDTMTESRNKSKQSQLNIMKDHLTNREIEIIKLVCSGFSNQQIAEKLIRSPRTIDTHRTNIMKKINVHNIAGLMRYAIENGIHE
jgi:DNA-binding NarL/FixJ family response regulator